MAALEQDRQPYHSPGGTYECILKSVLEDPSLTNAEFRVLLYAVTKQDGWKFYPGHIVRALGRTKFEVEKALAGLVRKGYAVQAQDRQAGGKFMASFYRFGLDLVLRRPGDEPAQVAAGDPESAPAEGDEPAQVAAGGLESTPAVAGGSTQVAAGDPLAGGPVAGGPGFEHRVSTEVSEDSDKSEGAPPPPGPAPDQEQVPEGKPDPGPIPDHGPAPIASATALEEKEGGAAPAATDAQLLHRMFTERQFGPLALRLAQRYRAARKGGYQSEAEVARVLESLLPGIDGDDGYREFLRDLQYAAGREEVPLAKGTLGVAHSRRINEERRQQQPQAGRRYVARPDWNDPGTTVRL
jgi:hypothetical protein